MAKLTVEQLINTATELNDVMGFNEEDAPPVEGTKEELQAWVKEAAEELQPPDEISKESQIVLQALDVWVNQEDRKDLDADEEDETAPEAETETETDGPDLVKELDETETLKDLKTMVKANDEFKSLRGSITKYKAGEEEELKEAMFVLLEPVEEEEKPETKEIKMTPSGKEEVPIPKLKKKEEKKEKESSNSKPKGPGIIATIASLIEKSGSKGITKDEIHEKLTEAFPDRNKDSMKNTINVQVLNRITKEKFKVERLEEGKYRKA